MSATTVRSALSSLQTPLARRYVFQRELGRGGVARVFLARAVAEDRLVAVKVLLPELAMTIGTERFLREIEVARALSHPRIVGVLDSGELDGIPYYVMPFAEGGSLRERLKRETHLPINDAIEIVRQVGDALDYAHRKGVIHRDIKPENILLDRTGALVADFGIARAASIAASNEPLTKAGMAVGTPPYMSPEQAMGNDDVTPASDVYSLACVLYEMLAGRPPFTGPTRGIVLARHMLDIPPRLRTIRVDVSDAIEDAIDRALAKSPADRFPTFTEFGAALTDYEGAARRRQEPAHSRSATILQSHGRDAWSDTRITGWWRRRVQRVRAALTLPTSRSRVM